MKNLTIIIAIFILATGCNSYDGRGARPVQGHAVDYRKSCLPRPIGGVNWCYNWSIEQEEVNNGNDSLPLNLTCTNQNGTVILEVNYLVGDHQFKTDDIKVGDRIECVGWHGWINAVLDDLRDQPYDVEFTFVVLEDSVNLISANEWDVWANTINEVSGISCNFTFRWKEVVQGANEIRDGSDRLDCVNTGTSTNHTKLHELQSNENGKLEWKKTVFDKLLLKNEKDGAVLTSPPSDWQYYALEVETILLTAPDLTNVTVFAIQITGTVEYFPESVLEGTLP